MLLVYLAAAIIIIKRYIMQPQAIANQDISLAFCADFVAPAWSPLP